MALASNDLAGMRKYAVCATTINRQETSASLNRKVAAAVIDVLLLSTHSSSIPQLVDQDFEMLRHLVRHGITFGRESLREVVLMCHFSLGKFLVEEAGVVPSMFDQEDISWQIMHAIFMPRFGITAVGKMLLDQKLRNRSSTKGWHGDINLSFVTDISSTYAKLFERGSMSQISVRELRQGANEVHAAFLDLFLTIPAYVKNLCHSRKTSTTKRTLMHVVAASSDPVSIVKLLKVSHEQECPALTESLEVQDAFGFTVMDLAARAGDLISLELLLRENNEHDDIELRMKGLLTKFDPKSRIKRKMMPKNNQGKEKRDERRCDIDEIDAGSLNATYFYHHYYLPRRPVLIHHGCKKWKAMKHWNLNYLDRHLRGVEVTVSQIPYAKQFGLNDISLESMRSLPSVTKNSSLDQVPYVFDGTLLNQSPKLLDDFPMLPWFAEPPKHLNEDSLGLQLDPPQLYVGSAGSGSPMHFHSDALNACFKGEKLYALLPPEAAIYSITPLDKWLEKEENRNAYKKKLLFCTQRRGEIIFIPGMYAHGVVNQKKVIGVATEILSRHGEDLLWF
jgi:hypothetical protein